jgi:polysaccharide pyruvyl transferase CsaB
MARKIFLLGAYGQGNIGDEAILEVFIKELRDYELSIASSNPMKTQARFNLPVVSTYGDFRKKLALLLDSYAVIFGGGSLLKELNPQVTGRFRYSLLLNLLIGVCFAKVLRKKVVFSAIGVGPINRFISRILTRLSLLFVDTVTVREKNSQFLLSNMGYEHSLLTADPTFLLANVQKIALSSGFETSLRIGMCPEYYYCEGVSWKAMVDIFSSFIDSLIEDYDSEVFLLPFQSGYRIKNDQRLIVNIYNRIKCKSKVHVLQDNSLEKTRQIFASLDFVIGVRLHSLILAFIEKKPFLAIIHDEKVQYFLQDLGLEHNAIEGCELNTEKLKKKFEKIYKNKEIILKHLEKNLPLFKERAKQNFRYLKKFLELQT